MAKKRTKRRKKIVEEKPKHSDFYVQINGYAVVHPGKRVAALVSCLDWPLEEIAGRLNVSAQYLEMIMDGSIRITEIFAASLNCVFESPMGYWMDLQETYDRERRIERYEQREKEYQEMERRYVEKYMR